MAIMFCSVFDATFALFGRPAFAGKSYLPDFE